MPKEWKFSIHHPKDKITREPSERFRTKLIGHLAFLSQIEPKNFKEAEFDEFWILVMQEELVQFERNQVWELVPRPYQKYIIGTKWVLRNKLDDSGTIIRNKAD